MKTGTTVRTIALSLLVAAAAPAFAQVTFNISVGPPPAPQYEAVPVLAPGYVWAPGYWAWHDDRHIWVHGRTMVQRVGYRWEPDVWEQRNNTYYRHAGRWERDVQYKPAQFKQEKKPKHWDNRDHDGGKPGKGPKNDNH